jgi:hypothetical protein
MRKKFMIDTSRYERGWKKLGEIDGKAGERVIEDLQSISPDFARYLIELRARVRHNGDPGSWLLAKVEPSGSYLTRFEPA